MTVPSLMSFMVFFGGSVPLVWQDARTLSVSQPLLYGVFALWMVSAFWWAPSWSAGAALSAGTLTVGTVFLLLSPGALGEADVIYMAALAWLLPFWSFLVAMALACLLGLAAYLWLSRAGTRDVSDLALPYLPCLALGAAGVLGGNV